MTLLVAAADKPAAGAALTEVFEATGIAVAILAALGYVVYRQRHGHETLLGRFATRISSAQGLPRWAAFPQDFLIGSLIVAVFGMYWDISIHIDKGRDPGPLANPAHYWILFGLFGVFSSGVFALALARNPLPTRTLRLTRNWSVPIGAVLICVCGTFSLLGFPLDDLWHRMFGQDVTLFGPTHLMMIGGASLSTIAGYVLLLEGRQASPDQNKPAVLRLREISMAGALLIGLSTFQAEFDFGVPQFPFALELVMVMTAATVALVTARVRIGPGGAIAAVAVYLGVRGLLALIISGPLGRSTPHFQLYIAEALCVEAAAWLLRRQRPVLVGAVAGLLVGTAGQAAEWGWSHVWAVLPWPSTLFPAGAAAGLVAAIGGGIVGAWMGQRLTDISDPDTVRRQGERRAGLVTHPLGRLVVAAGGLAVIAMLVGTVPYRADRKMTGTVTLQQVTPVPFRTVQVTLRLSPQNAADDADWLLATAWQGGGSIVEPLHKVAPGVYQTSKPIPVYGQWKATLRYNRGNDVEGLAVYFPRDDAIPAPAVRADPSFTRPFQLDKHLLQREQKPNVPQWLSLLAYGVVALITVVTVGTLSWGLRAAAGLVHRGPGSGATGAVARPSARRPRRRMAARTA